jgi:hypothetical protein
MKLSSFRELLLKKVQHDTNLAALLKYAREDVLADAVVESLEKMARASHKGDAANFAVRRFGTEMDPETEPHMLREAIGHHVSRYKGALGQGRQDLANQHAKQAFNLMNMADTAQKHSGGKLSIDYVDPKPWERNKYTKQYTADHPKVQEGKYKEGDFTTKTKGLRYALTGNDFSHLNQPPHESYSNEIKRHKHNKAYPFEQVRINGKYIPVEDVKDLKGYEGHEFDKHPIMSHFHESPNDRTPARDQEYIAAHDKYHNQDPHVENFFNRQADIESKDPQAYTERGSKPAEPVHGDVGELELGDEEAAAASKSTKKEVATPQGPVQRPAGVDEGAWSTMSPEVQAALAQYMGKK